jgi:hypothetical protein
MSLAELQRVLQAQADAGQRVTVSEATLAQAGLRPRPGLDALLRGQLQLAADLTVGYAGQVPPPDGETLALSGPAALLGVAAATVDVAFRVTDDIADVRVAVELPDGWTLDAAFSGLGKKPFSQLDLTAIRYLVTTRTGDSYFWNGRARPLRPGAQLLSLLRLDSPLALVTGLLTGGTPADTVELTGLIDPAGGTEETPELALSAPIARGLDVPFFSLSAPRIEIGSATADDDDGGGTVAWLAFATTLSFDGQPLCDFKALISAAARQVAFSLWPLDPAAPPRLSRADTFRLLGVDYGGAVPDLLASVFETVTVTGLSATFSVGPVRLLSVGARLGASGPWGYGQFQVTQTTLELLAVPASTAPASWIPTVQAPAETVFGVSFTARARLFAAVFQGDFDLDVGYDTASGDLAVAAGFTGEMPLSAVVEGLSDGRVRLPEELEIWFGDFGAALHRPSDGQSAYTLWGAVGAAVTLPFLGVHLDGDLEALVESAEERYELVGGLLIGDSAFSVIVNLAGDEKTVAGSWTALGSEYLGIATLADAIGTPAPPISPDLDLNLKSAALGYNFSSRILALRAESAAWGRAVLVALRSDDWVFFAGLDIDRRIALSDLPVIGEKLSGIVSLSVERIRALVSSPLDAGAAALINGELARLGAEYPQAPDAGLSGAALTMVFDVAGERVAVTLATPPDPGRANEVLPRPGTALARRDAAPPSPADGTIWISVQKSFGPVSFEKVGLRYRDGELQFLMNASLAAGGLVIEALGLGAGSPLSSFEPRFTIDGLAVSYAGGPVTLSGALNGTLDPVDFTGELVLGAGQLQVGAIGGYCEVAGHPSLFAFAVLDYPIGGPAFFFITGLAAGFGFNRRLAIPPVEEVASFPFVAWARGEGNPPPMARKGIGETVRKVLGELSAAGTVAPSVGDNWLAAGVRFTSFKLVSSFALLTVAFGTRVEIALLGISSVQLPPAPARPVALAELQLKAAFIPDEGVLSVSGQLTPRSYLLSPDCHLTGGFALVTWLTGDHEGEFVLTLGGYSPRFTRPDHYPAVPRLALTWRVTSELTISGNLYFALTSAAVMAGGGLSAVWQSGAIRAWFEVEAHFLLVFEPFHYYIEARISLGVSVTINLWFTSFTITVQLGVGVEVWGPEFAGRVRVDLSIVSFTIAFGPGAPDKRTTIDWADFVDRLIPGADAAALPGPGAQQSGVVQVSVQDGLLARLSDDDGELNWVVDGEALRLVTQSAIPSTGWEFTGDIRLAPGAPDPNTDFGVGPVGLAAGELDSRHHITITAGAFLAEPVLRNVPAALWRETGFDGNGVPAGLDPLHDTTVEGVSVGFTLVPAAGQPSHTLPVRTEDLEYSPVGGPGFAWSDATAPRTDPFGGETVWETITAPGAEAVRGGLIAAMAAEGWRMPGHVDVSELASRVEYDLAADPALRLLGEQR